MMTFPIANSFRSSRRRLFALVVVFALLLPLGQNQTLVANVCPFCQAINLTFAEQLGSKDVAVVAKLLKLPKPVDNPDVDLPKASMEVTNVLKGEKFVAVGMKFNLVVVGTYPIGQEFLVMGVDPPNISWTTPMKANDRVFNYLETIQTLPEKGADRLAFFQDYFEDEESILAFDAYDEFAKAPYEDLIDLKNRMQKDKLVNWIKDMELSPNRRRLYLTMLGVCGGEDEAKVLEGFIKSGDRYQQAGLDALLASYLTLKGADGLPLIVDTFLKNKETEYVDVLAAVSALRFHGTEVDIVPKKDIIAAVRHILDRPRMADMVIPDLARWQDWSVMERLVQMFKDADDETNWLRVPVITYLRECPKPEAKSYIDELAKIDPDAVTRADFFSQSLDDFDDDSDDQTPAQEETTSSEDEATEIGKSKAHATESLAPATNDSSHLRYSNEHKVLRVSLPATAANQTNEGDVTTMAASEAGPVAQSIAEQPPTSVAAVEITRKLTLSIIFIPMVVSALLFVVLWSVVSGWFERLIF